MERGVAGRRLEAFAGLPHVMASPRLMRLVSAEPMANDEFVRWALQTRLTTLIQEAIPEFLILKGQPLAMRSYDAPAKRWTSDIDVLVPPDRIEHAASRLEALGFAPHGARRPWAYNQQMFVKSGVPIPVELHWRMALPFMPAPAWRDLFERSQPVALGGTEIRTTGVADTVLNLCLHFIQHLGELRVAMDLAAFLDATDGALDEARAIAIALGMELIFEIGVLCASPDETTARPLARSFAEGMWEMWRSGEELGDQEWANFLTQCASGALRDDHRLVSILRWAWFGPHRFGTGSAEFLRRISQNHFDRLTRLE